MEGNKFTVFLKSERLPVLLEISKIIAEFRNTIPYEATYAAKKSWGFLEDDLDEAAADKLLAVCAAHGHEARKAETARLPALKPPMIIKWLDFGDGRLNYRLPGAEASEPLENLIITAYAPIKYTFSKTVNTKEGPSTGEKAVRLGIMMTTGLPIGMGKSKEVKKEIKNTEITFYMDLVFLNGLRLRLNSDNFDFSCLKEKKTYSSQMNFSLLCLELAKAAPAALKNTGMYDVIEGKVIPTLQYDSPEDMEKEMRRLLLLKSPF